MKKLKPQPTPSIFFRIGAFLDPIRPKWSNRKTLEELDLAEGIEYKKKRAWRQFRWGLERGRKAYEKTRSNGKRLIIEKE